MKNSIFRTLLSCATMLAISLAGITALHAEQPAEPGPMALQGIMIKLGQDMQAVTAAISIEDWATVERLAPGIADHAEPPGEEKARIIGWLGKDAPKFRGYDMQAHEAAAVMGEAAARKDGVAAIAAFARVQESCLGCHQEFRQPFMAHFYGGH